MTLLGPLPETVDVGGTATPIRTGFRVGMLLDGLLWDRTVGDVERVALGLRLLYPQVPEDGEAAWRAAMWFYAGGREAADGGGDGKRVYDFERDADVLYAAFWEQYGVDLMAAALHWWQFRAMFVGLKEDCAMRQRMWVRGVNLAEVEGRAERVRLARLKRAYRLEDGVRGDAFL